MAPRQASGFQSVDFKPVYQGSLSQQPITEPQLSVVVSQRARRAKPSPDYVGIHQISLSIVFVSSWYLRQAPHAEQGYLGKSQLRITLISEVRYQSYKTGAEAEEYSRSGQCDMPGKPVHTSWCWPLWPTHFQTSLHQPRPQELTNFLALEEMGMNMVKIHHIKFLKYYILLRSLKLYVLTSSS